MTRVCALLFVLFFVGCGAAQKVGVRKTFKNRTVERVAVIDVYATGQFSLDDDAFAALRDTYVAATEATLSELGFSVVTTKEFESSFESPEARERFWGGIPTHNSLEPMFERNRGEVGTEAETVIAFSKQLPANALFIAEVVYFTQGVCDSKTTDYTTHVVIEPEGVRTPAPCVVSHYQAKLIDSATGSTMWHNRVMLEHRGAVKPEELREVIFENVRRVLMSHDGLGNFRSRS